MKTFTPKLKPIPESSLRNLLVSAFEGGSSYWMEIFGLNYAKDLNKTDFDKGGKHYPSGNEHWPAVYLVPFVEKCNVILIDNEDDNKRYYLGIEEIQQGIDAMASKYPKHFGDFMSENDDQITADVFLQCSIFGEIKYG